MGAFTGGYARLAEKDSPFGVISQTFHANFDPRACIGSTLLAYGDASPRGRGFRILAISPRNSDFGSAVGLSPSSVPKFQHKTDHFLLLWSGINHRSGQYPHWGQINGLLLTPYDSAHHLDDDNWAPSCSRNP